MLKKTVGLLLVVVAISVLTACSSFLAYAAAIQATESHEHRLPNTMPLGHRHLHATMEYDPDEGEIAILFLDADEKPYRIFKKARAKAIFTTEGESEKDFFFYQSSIKAPSGSFCEGEEIGRSL